MDSVEESSEKSVGGEKGSENPVESSMENPVESPVENPSENPVENPSENVIETPKEGPAENPKDSLIDNPSENQIQNPSESLIENPSENQIQNPSESSVENPYKSPVENSRESPNENPSESLIGNPSESPIENPSESPIGNPSESPIENPSESIIENPSESPVGNPIENPSENPIKNPCESPIENSRESPIENPIETPSEEPFLKSVDNSAQLVTCKKDNSDDMEIEESDLERADDVNTKDECEDENLETNISVDVTVKNDLKDDISLQNEQESECGVDEVLKANKNNYERVEEGPKQDSVQSKESERYSSDEISIKMEVDSPQEEKIQVEVTEPKQKISKRSLEDNRSLKLEEGEEEFRGFPAISEELPNQGLVKNLSQREETELQEMEVFVKTKSEQRTSPLLKRRRRDADESDLSSHCSSPALSVTSQLSGLSFSKRSRTGSPASRGSRRSTVDLSNPKYLVPFDYGWKREVVTRAITSREDGISKDVYYFHPCGKKLRSLREVSEKLTPGVTIENFTFYKEALGADPQFETIRNARSRGYSPFEPSTPKSSVSPIPVKSQVVKTTPELPPIKEAPTREPSPVKEGVKPAPLKNFVKTPKEPVAKPPPPKREKLVLKFNKGTPKIALKKAAAVNGERKSPKMMLPKVEGPKPHPNAPSGPRRKITPRKKPLKPQNGNKEDAKGPSKPEGGDMEMGMLPPMWSPTAGSNKSSSNESLSWSHLDEEKSSNEEGRLDPCTIRCTRAMGLIPTLQCSVCLCLYHPECCDMASSSSYRQITKYVCKNCQVKSRNLVKHITPAVVTDKNPPIISPKPIHPGLIPSPTIPTGPGPVRVPHVIRPKLPSSKSSWLPPSNSVFRSPSIPKNYPAKPEEASTPPQALVNMNNRRYIVVPKNNVLSVASNPNQSPGKFDPLQSTTIITPTPTSTIIQGPPLQNNPFIQPAANSPGVVLVPFLPGESVPLDSSPQQYLVVNPLPGSSATPGSSQADLPTGTETIDHFPKASDKMTKKPTTDGGNETMQKFMRNICIGYSALLNVFQYLKVQELLRAGRVCRLWRDLASHSSLWRTVRMKNSQVSDWKGFTDSLSRHGTKHLDLRKMLMSLDDAEEMWTTFAKHISNVKCLERLDMCRCSVNVVGQIMEACPQLAVFNAQMIGVKDQILNQKLPLESVSKMKNLKELRLKSFFGLHILGSLKALVELSDTLTTLSLTSVKNLGACEVQYIGKLSRLEALELGECSDLPESFPNDVIAKLITLKRIRLEKGPWNCSTNEMLFQMSKLKDLVQLELINFDVRPGFDKALASCTNIKRLLLIPTYVTQSATTNNIILSGTFKLWRSLTHFVWVVTMELLKVTELFVDQCEGKGSRKGGGNSVPVLKPVPQPAVKLNQRESDSPQKEGNETGSKNPTPITVIPIDELFQMLTEALPTTKVKLLKIPFQNTWRQSITEGSS